MDHKTKFYKSLVKTASALKKEARARRFSYKQVANRAGLPEYRVQRLLDNKVRWGSVRMGTIQRIASALGMRIEYKFGINSGYSNSFGVE